MNKFIFVAFAVSATVAGWSQSITNSVLNSSLSTVTSTETVVNHTVSRAVSGFSLTSGDAQSIAWSYNFAATNPGEKYSNIKLVVRGYMLPNPGAAAAVQIIGTEEVFDTSAMTSVNVGSGVLNYSGSAQSPQSFTAEVNIPLAPSSAMGTVSKDILFINTGAGIVQVNSIDQTFTPVPEPASMVALAAGLAALARKRRK